MRRASLGLLGLLLATGLGTGACRGQQGRPATPAPTVYAVRLDLQAVAARSYASEHHYSLEQFGISKEEVYADLKEVFEEFGFER